MKTTIIIPAYNEERRIIPMLEDYCSYFSRLPRKDIDLFVILNGCKDHTLDIVKRFAKKYSFLHYINIKEGIGKGGAVLEGFKRARSYFVGFADADGSTRAQYYHDLMKKIGDADGIIASRWMKDSVVEPRQPFSRRFASRAFNILVRIFFGLRYHDTQCGFKLFKTKTIHTILPYLGMTRWAFDVDVLYHLKKHGFTVKEIPTVWKDSVGSTIRVPKVSFEMFLALVRLRLLYSPFRFLVGVYNRLFSAFGIKF